VALRPHVTVVGLGPAGADLLTDHAASLLSSPHAYVRTARHPAAAPFGRLHSFDNLYESAANFEEVYGAIVEELVHAAEAVAPEPVVYAVPGSPLVAERTVELLRADERIDVTVVPALSFLDLAWAALGIDPVADGVRLADATGLGSAPLGDGPLLLAQCWSRLVLSDVKLALEDAVTEPPRPVILHHLGLPDEMVVSVDWWELDRTIEPDHLTSLYIPSGAGSAGGSGTGTLAGLHADAEADADANANANANANAGRAVADLVTLMDTLRERCPWDRAQSHASLMPHLVEECYEVLDALAALAALGRRGGEGEPGGGGERGERETPGEWDAAYGHLQEELGDLLFQIVFHARLAEEVGAFDLGDVARTVRDKLVHRHPHVFADVAVERPDQVEQNWEDIKKSEKGRQSVTEGIPNALPALMLTTKLARKARAVGLDPTSAADGPVLADLAALQERAARQDPHPDDPLSSETDEASRQVGDVLYAVATLAQRVGVDAEQALRERALSLRTAILAAEGVPDRENGTR
jgi:tetrapyrrole methylase family protein/MazG family protein